MSIHSVKKKKKMILLRFVGAACSRMQTGLKTIMALSAIGDQGKLMPMLVADSLNIKINYLTFPTPSDKNRKNER